jgi:hypothetical protein
MQKLLTCLAVLSVFLVRVSAAVTTNDVTDVNITAFVPCADGGNGELVNLSGPLHTLISSTLNGNNVSGYYHFQPQNVSAACETTGANYQAVGVTQESFKGSLQNGQLNFTIVNNFRIIGEGAGNNLLVHETMHLTINADGTATAFHDNFMFECR